MRACSAHANGFGHIALRAQFQPAHLVALRATRRDDDDGHVLGVLLLLLAQEGESVLFAQPQIEQKKRVREIFLETAVQHQRADHVAGEIIFLVLAAPDVAKGAAEIPGDLVERVASSLVDAVEELILEVVDVRLREHGPKAVVPPHCLYSAQR